MEIGIVGWATPTGIGYINSDLWSLGIADRWLVPAHPLLGVDERVLEGARAAGVTRCRLEGEPVLNGRLNFRGGETLVLINDRLLAPNTEETFAAIRADVEDLARTLYGGAEFSFQREQDPRKRFGLRIKTPGLFDVATLLKNVEQNVN